MLFDHLLFLADSEPSGLAAFGTSVLLWARVALGIGLVIFVHELGHFVAAKTFGVKCEKFYVGFDPPIKIGPIKLPSSLGRFQYGETEYGIGIIPLGGYVKMLGQDDDPRRFREESARARGEQLEPDDEDAFEDTEVQAEEPGFEGELDPRSFPAKPVWQRMVIMSAGVFMNLITGALFAMIAYFYGVPYTPAMVGGPSPGGPAWQAGIQPGGQIVAVDGVDEDQMHFREMASAIIHAGLEEPDRAVPVRVSYDDVETEFNLKTMPYPGQKSRPMIGILSPSTLKLSSRTDPVPSSVAADVLTEEHQGATITSYNGIEVDGEATLPATAFLNYLYSNPDKPIELTLEKVDPETQDVSTFQVTLPVQPSQSIGIQLAVGEVTALISGGPAEAAGLKVDDVIESVEGLETLDAKGFLLHLARREPLAMSVRRGNETVSLSITPNDAAQTLVPESELGEQAAFNAFGFAFAVRDVIGSFDKRCLVEGDPLESGDELKEIKLLPSNELPDEFEESPLDDTVEELTEGWKFEQKQNGSRLLRRLQYFPEGTRFKLLAKRAGSGVIKESILEVKTDASRPQFQRGLVLAPLERVQTASSLSEASALGIRESGRRFTEVLRFLRMAVTGRVSTEHVGGPIRIFQVAGSEAEQGISKQLLFLTLLSMNLAILNFLPIPVLDGGHMMFLMYEMAMGRRVNEEIEMRLTLVGGIMLLGLMVFVVFNDILNF
ncbi:MAG: site-2 protease family protein [Planctomycetota bacterium]